MFRVCVMLTPVVGDLHAVCPACSSRACVQPVEPGPKAKAKAKGLLSTEDLEAVSESRPPQLQSPCM